MPVTSRRNHSTKNSPAHQIFLIQPNAHSQKWVDFLKNLSLSKVDTRNKYDYNMEINWLQGNFTINDLQLDESFFPSILPTGPNYLQIQYLVENKIVFGVRIYSDIQKA